MTINFNTLADVPLLEGLHPDEVNALAPQFETRMYAKGDTLFLKGDPGGALLIVTSGIIELFIYDENQQRIVLNHIGTGGFFGEVSLFDNGERTANAMATEKSEVLILRQDVMVDFLRKHPDTAIHVINVLSKRLRDNTTLLASNNNRSASQVLREKRSNLWDRVADSAANHVGSWPYLTLIVVLVVVWIFLNVSRLVETWDKPFEFNILNLVLTIIAALQVPLILMAQRRQDEYAGIAADLEYEVNLKAQLSILEVNRKLDWLRDSMLDQTARLEKLEERQQGHEEDHEADHESLHAGDAGSKVQ